MQYRSFAKAFEINLELKEEKILNKRIQATAI